VKRYRLTIILLAVFAALGAYVWFFERGEVSAPLAWRLDRARIQRIELAARGKTTVLSRRDGSWRITKPVSAPVDRDRMRRLLNRVSKLEIRRRIERPENLKVARSRATATAAEGLAAYGLARPAGIVRVVLSGGERRELVLGVRTPDSSSAYAMNKGAADVLLVAPALLDDAVGGADALRDHAALRFKVADVVAVTLTRPGGQVKLVKRKGEWDIVEPAATRADRDAVSGFLASLAQLRATRFVAESAPNPAQYSLHQPRLAIELAFAGATQPARLSFGGPSTHSTGSEPALSKAKGQAGSGPPRAFTPSTVEGKSRGGETDTSELYARNTQHPAVMVVPESAFANVNRTLDDLRSQRVAEFSVLDVQSVAIARGNQRVELRREKDRRWIITSPARMQADAHKVEDLLYALSDVRAHSFIDNPGSLVAYGLDLLVAAVTLYRGQGAEPARFMFGAPAGEGRIYAKSSGQTIFEVPADILSQLPAGIEDLRERHPRDEKPKAGR